MPVITPAERSNSPPIISSATATAMIPYDEATSVQLAMPLSVPKASVVTQKNTQTTSAPRSEPTSGRRMSRAHEADVGQPLVRDRLRVGAAPAGAAGLPPPMASDISASLPPRAVATVSALSFVTKPGPVSTGWPPPTVFALVL